MKQGFRMIRSTGVLLIILTLLATVGIVMTMLSNIISWSPLWVVVVIFGILFSIHVYRGDIQFLDTVSRSDYDVPILIFLEYIIITGPILFFHFYWGNYSVVAISILGILLLSSLYDKIKINKWNKSKVNLKFIPLELFEIKFRIEQHPIIFLLIFSVSVFSFVHVGFLVVSMILFLLVLIDGYNASEPPEMIHWRPKFVWSKIIRSIAFLLALFLFQIVVGLIFYPEFALLILYVVTVFSILLALIISYKYSTFNPINPLSASSNVLSIFILLSLLPGGILVTLPFAIYHYLRSERNMKMYYA